MPTLIELLEAGAHFGHKKERSHPKAKEYIFTLREGVYVIDLDKTISYLEKALEFLKKEATLGKTILFVGTKRQAKELVQKVAESVSMPYINQRWLGGTLTNFETIRRNLKKLEELEAQVQDVKFANLTKKEQKVINDKIAKLQQNFGGVRTMKNLPDVIFVVDAAKEKLAIAEGNRMEIPIVAITDTDADPSKITYPIPANDDAPKTLEMLMGIVQKVLSGASVKTETKETKEEVKEIKKEQEEVVEEKKKVTKKIVKKSATKSKSKEK